jgi:hypothetical protein
MVSNTQSTPAFGEGIFLPGGTVRVGAQPAFQGAPEPGPSSRVYGGVTRATANDEGFSAETVGEVVRMTHSRDGVAGGSISATLDRRGATDTVEMIPGNPASRVSVATALREGLLRRGASGSLEDARGSTSQTSESKTAPQGADLSTQQNAQAQADALAEAQALKGVFDAKEDRQWAHTFEAIPEHAFNGASASMVKALTFGEGFEGAANNLARSTGMDPSAAMELVEYGYSAQRAIVDRAIANAGVPAAEQEAFYAYCVENPGKLQEAIGRLMHGRDVSKFQALARSWIARQQRGGQR